MNTNEALATDAANEARFTADAAYLTVLASKPAYRTAIADHAHTTLCHNCPL